MAAPSRVLLTELRISHLRSFGHETVIRLRAGLNVIVGANGSGKSNALDAVLFALLQEPALLRVRTWAELANRARVGPCAVRLTYASPSAEPRLVLMAHVKEDASRAFKLNGGTATAAQAREALLELGIDTSVPSFCVRQHSAARPIDDAVLTRLLLQASGAAHWQASAAHSRSQLVKERETLTRVQEDIRSIEALLEREREAQASLYRLLQLRGRERRGRASMAVLAERLAVAAKKSHAAALADGRTRAARVRQAIADLEGARRTQSKRLAETVTAAQRVRAEATAAVRAVEAAREAAAAAEGEMLHAVVLREQARREQATLACQQERRQAAAHRRHLVSCRQRGALRAAREAAVETEAARAEAHATCQRTAAATSGGWLVDGALTQLRQQTVRRQRLERLASDDATGAAAEARARLELAEAEASERAKDIAAEAARLEAARAARQSAEARAEQAQAAAEAVHSNLLGDEPGRGHGGVGGSLEAAAAQAEMAAAAAAERERQAVARLRLIDPEYRPPTAAATATRDSTASGANAAADASAAAADARVAPAPSLASVLRLATTDARLPRCLLALDVLAGRHLGVRLTSTAEAAVPLLAAARRRGEGVRIWPIASLRARAVPPSSIAVLQRRLGHQHVIAPSDLIASAGPLRHRERERPAGVGARASATGTGGGERRDTAGTGEDDADDNADDGGGGGGVDEDDAKETAEGRGAAGAADPEAGRGTMWAAVQHAFGSSLIISSDEHASACLETDGVSRCVTLAGTVHQRAKLQGGYRDATSQPNGFAALLECQNAAAAAATASEHACSLASALAVHRAAPHAAAAAAAAAADAERLAVRLAQLRASEAIERGAMGDAAETLGEQSGRATAAAAHAQRLQADVAALDAIGSVGSGGEGRSSSGGAGDLGEAVVALRELSARREEDAASAQALVARLEEETRRYESVEEQGRDHREGEGEQPMGEDGNSSSPGDAVASLEADVDADAAALLEEEEEQQAALGHAATALRHAERQLLLADRHAATAAAATAEAEAAEREVRAEGKGIAQQLDTAHEEAAAAAAVVESLSRGEAGTVAAAAVPEIVGRWLGASPNLEDDEGDEDADDETAEAEALAGAVTVAAATAGLAPSDHTVDGGEEDAGDSDAARPEAAEADDFAAGLAADADADVLRACLESAEVQLDTWLRERQELQRTHGSCAALRARLASARSLTSGAASFGNQGNGEASGSGVGEGSGSGALDMLQQLQRKTRTVAASISTLTTGLEAMQARVAQANVEAVGQVRRQTASLFASLVPSMQADIECDEPEQLEAKGARFRVRASRAGGTGDAMATGRERGGERAGEGEGEWRYGTAELSGGQRTLLNLALLLALARLRPCPLLLLDEMDAALDESNAAKVAALLSELSATCQVIAISHRVELHRAAHHIVRLHKGKEYTVVSEG